MADTAPDAITLLKDDHRKVEALFKQFNEAKGKATKKKVAEQISVALIVHTRIENDHFYPACKGAVEDADLKEAYVEHDAANVLIAEILEGGPNDEYYDAKVKVLQEEIDHHVKEEEGWLSGIFSQAKRHGVDMDMLGADLAKAKAKYEAEIEKDGPHIVLAALKKTRVAAS